MTTLDHLAGLLLEHLAWASLQAPLLIALIALLLRWRPGLPAAARSLLWWLVGLQLLLGLGARVPLTVTLPGRAAAVLQAPAMQHASPAARIPHSAPAAATTTHMSAEHAVAPQTSTTATVHLPTILAALWLLGVATQLLLLTREARRNRALYRHGSQPANAARHAEFERLVERMGLRHAPRLRITETLTSPQVSGLWHPVVLMPAQLDDAEWTLALGHELAHLRRHDLWLAWVPTLARLLFFFHPGVWSATREYALHREAACDALALQRTGLTAHAYGRLLLRLGAQRTPQAVLAGASPTFRTLHRRLTMLQQNLHAPTSRLHHWMWLVAIAAVGVLPYRLAAAPAPTSTQSTAPAPLPPAPPAPPAPPPAQPPAPPAPPPAPPAPPAPITADGHVLHNVDIDTHKGAATGIALAYDSTLTVEGSNEDLQAAMHQLRHSRPPMLWYRDGKQAYVSHDPALVKAAQSTYAQVRKLALQQGRLAGHMGELSGRQGALAAEEGALASARARLAERRAQLAERRAQLVQEDSSNAQTERRTLSRTEAALQREETRLKQKEVEQHRKAARQRRELDAQRRQLGTQRKHLQQQQAKAREQAQQALQSLLQKAVRDGRAQPVKAD